MKQLDVTSYRRVNETFRRRMVCRIGVDCGLFVEMSYMVNAMLYCLAHHIKFQLYSDDANFGTGQGWTEYFQPFCEEVHETFHKRFNFHRRPSWYRVMRLCGSQKSMKPIAWKLKSIQNTLAGRLMAFRAYHEYVLFAQDVPPKPEQHYNIPELGIDSDYTSTFALLSRMIWRLQPEVLSLEEVYKNGLSLPSSYSGVQIRGGDKATETHLVDGKIIIQKLSLQNGDCLFILTDDYRQFLKAKADFPQLRLLTLCQPYERGYHHRQFCQEGPQSKKDAINRLIISVDLLLSSHSFAGSIITGPSVFILKLRIDDPLAQAVDCPKEGLTSALQLPVYVRSIISRRRVDGQLGRHAD